MSSKPNISVVIPIYNVEKYLSACIDSILVQDFNNLEILLINDGSTDESLNICKEYEKKSEIIKVYSKENGGVSSARNFGINKANGKYICFIDADDKVLGCYLNNFYGYAERNKCKVIVSDYKLSNGEVRKTNFKKNTVLKGNELILSSKYVHTNNDLCFPWRYFYRLDLIIENGIYFDERITIGEDTIFNMEVLTLTDKAMAIDSLMYEYTIDNPNSAMKAKYKPNLDRSLVLQYEKRRELSNKYKLIDNRDYARDMANYYNSSIFGMLINNLRNSDYLNKEIMLKSIINYDMFLDSYRILKFRSGIKNIKEYVLYLAKYFRWGVIINYFYKIY